MAKAADIEVSPWEPYAAAAARIVRTRTEELFAHVDGVLDTEDIERVHDMRVATRRLRAVLETFEPCFPAAPFKAALKDVKALADALGERRDPDVHIAALEAFAAAVPAADRAGVRELIERQRARQTAANAALAAALERARDSDLDARLRALAEAAQP